MIKNEINIILTALMFYTRIPVTRRLQYSPEMLNKSTRYFPFVGWIVGGSVALVYTLSAKVFPESISILLIMGAGIIITGAFHEDGFADVCDGFGGGWNKEDRLRIMKDSRIGAYGTIGIIMLLLTRFFLLFELSGANLFPILIAGHVLSRIVPVVVIFFGNYSRDDLTSKVKPIGQRISIGGFIFAICSGLLVLVLFPSFEFLTLPILPIGSGLLLMQYFSKRIGGYTGDCLGTIQQVSEIMVYLSIFIVYKLWSLPL